MVTLEKSGDSAVKFVFTDSDHYLFGDGVVEVPVNALILVIDESEMVTFKKLSGDPFLSFRADNSNLGTKAAIEQFYKDNMVGSTGGGGSESGITPSEVQEMIDESLDDYYDKDEVDAAFETVNASLSGKADTSDVTAVANDVSTLSGQVATKVDASDFSVYSAATDARLAEDEEVTAAALNDLDENKQDKLVYYEENTEDGYADIYMTNDDGQGNLDEYSFNIGSGSIDLGHYSQYDDGQGNSGYTSAYIQFANPEINMYAESDNNGETEATYFNITPLGVTINNENVATEPYVDAALSGKADTSAVTAVNDALTAHTSDTGIHVSAQEKNAWNAKAEPYSAGTGIDITDNVISATGGSSVTVDSTLDSGSTNPVANSAITAGINDAKAYYISFATIAQNGIHDADWDGIVAAIDDHRPIYAGYPRNDGGILYYGVECMNKNVSNTQIVLTSSDDNSHYFYTFTKNGSNDYTFTSETRPYVTDAEKTAWNAKAEPYSAGTGIEISGNVISATGGGGATYSAGYGINIDTANTISFNMPITCTTNTNDNITIGNGANNGSWSLLVGNDMSITNSTGSIGLCVSDMSIGGSSISGNSRGILIGCQNTIKGGNINVGGGVAIGDRNQSTDGGIVIGANSKASGSSTVAIGLSANATGTTKMNLNNQIKVDTNNQVYIKDKTNTTDVCIQDAIAALGGLKFVKLTQSEYDQLATKDNDTLYIITNVVS